jgi:uncharacterized membrane protein YgcG
VPIGVILVGVSLLILAARGTEHEFAKQLESDFGQAQQFVAAIAAIIIIGALGYVTQLRTLSNLMLALVIVVLVLKNGGLFTQLAQVVTHPPAPAAAVPLSSYGSGSSSSSSGGGMSAMGGGGGSNMQTAMTAAEIAAMFA